MNRVSSLDAGYRTGDLSLFPHARDSASQLYLAKNLSQTKLAQSLTYTGKYLIVEDASSFAATGLLRVGPPAGQPGDGEIIYYGVKTPTQFQGLQRGFAGSRQNAWPSGSFVTSGVMAEAHNTMKDAVQQIEVDLGTKGFPHATSLNGILVAVENKFLAPKPLFRGYPQIGPPPLRVRFQNFSNRGQVRYLWNFGDGTTSADTNPIHTYLTEGVFSVSMNLITQTGATGSVVKSNYINVSLEKKTPFFYVSPVQGNSSLRAQQLGVQPTEFQFVDQTDGNIIQRFWIFDDGESLTVTNPNIHTASHVYGKPGSYNPTILVVFANQQQARVYLKDTVTVF